MVHPPWVDVTMPEVMNAAPIINQDLEAIANPTASKPTSQPEMTSEQRTGCGWLIFSATIISLLILHRHVSFVNFAIWCVPLILFFAIIFWAICFPKSFEKYNTVPQKPTKNKPASKRATMVQSGLCLIGLVSIVWNIWPIIKTSYQDEQKNQSEISAANTSVKSTVGEYAISGDNFTGFIRSDDWEKSFELASDTEAFSRFFLQCAMSKRATLFKAGEAVILVEVDGLFGEKVRIRRKGETVSYWTVGNSIR
jgi:hypothetical protein